VEPGVTERAASSAERRARRTPHPSCGAMAHAGWILGASSIRVDMPNAPEERPKGGIK
jgi:hypothetical protein